MFSSYDYLGAPFWGWIGEEAPCRLVEVEVGMARFPPRGRDDTRRGGTWDLIYAPWKWRGERARVWGWCRSDQSGRVGER